MSKRNSNLKFNLIAGALIIIVTICSIRAVHKTKAEHKAFIKDYNIKYNNLIHERDSLQKIISKKDSASMSNTMDINRLFQLIEVLIDPEITESTKAEVAKHYNPENYK